MKGSVKLCRYTHKKLYYYTDRPDAHLSMHTDTSVYIRTNVRTAKWAGLGLSRLGYCKKSKLKTNTLTVTAQCRIRKKQQ